MKTPKIFIFPALVVLNFFLQPVPGIAQEFSSTIIVAHKAQNALGYYAADGRHLATVDVGPNPHEMVLSPDRSLVYITNNGVMRWMDEADGWNTVSIVSCGKKNRQDRENGGRRPSRSCLGYHDAVKLCQKLIYHE